jgi:hypothetical protein
MDYKSNDIYKSSTEYAENVGCMQGNRTNALFYWPGNELEEKGV